MGRCALVMSCLELIKKKGLFISSLKYDDGGAQIAIRSRVSFLTSPGSTPVPIYSADALPPFFTVEMNSWYLSFVRPHRNVELQAAISVFETCTLPRGGRGILFEHNRDSTELSKLHDIAAERETFKQVKEVQHVMSELEDVRTQYEALKAQNGRDAVKWRPVSYWIILFAFMLPEFLINWDSFLKIPSFTMAYASGLMLLVAIAFGYSAHTVGRIIKQWKELFGGYVGRTDKARSRRELAVGLTLFLLGIAAVAWGRWYFIQAAILEKEILRGGGLELSDYLQFIGAMLGNVIVYLLGFLWSFARHDSVPGFSELRARLDVLEARKLALFHQHLTSRNQQHIQQAQRKLESIIRVEVNQKANLNGYAKAREQFGIIKQTDDRVIALLNDYRAKLIDKLKGRRSSVRFRLDDVRVAELDTMTTLTLDQYAATPLELRYV
jgi:hypothetical protein